MTIQPQHLGRDRSPGPMQSGTAIKIDIALDADSFSRHDHPLEAARGEGAC